MKEKLYKLKYIFEQKTGIASRLEVTGTTELLLSGCRSLVDFCETLVVVETVSGTVSLSGQGLSVTVFRCDLLCVCGNIEKIEFGGGKC